MSGAEICLPNLLSLSMPCKLPRWLAPNPFPNAPSPETFVPLKSVPVNCRCEDGTNRQSRTGSYPRIYRFPTHMRLARVKARPYIDPPHVVELMPKRESSFHRRPRLRQIARILRGRCCVYFVSLHQGNLTGKPAACAQTHAFLIARLR